MATLKNLDLSDDQFRIRHTERGVLLTLEQNDQTTYHTYIPRVRDCNVQTYGMSTTVRVGNVFNVKMTTEQYGSDVGRTIMTAALGAGWAS